jgi:hypothetical protein
VRRGLPPGGNHGGRAWGSDRQGEVHPLLRLCEDLHHWGQAADARENPSILADGRRPLPGSERAGILLPEVRTDAGDLS